jgi:tRNA dimethylallyltransferase
MTLITLLGQTSSGKSDMAVELVRYLNLKGKKSCIVGCDSRQIYKDLNIGTGKAEGQWLYDEVLAKDVFQYCEIPHFMIDFVDPQTDYNLQNYICDFYDLILEINDQFDFVVLVGGTGLYAKTIVEKVNLGNLKFEYQIDYNTYKKELQNKDLEELQTKIDQQKLRLNNSDYHNKVRLVSNLLKAQCLEKGWLEPSQYFQFEKQCVFAIEIDQNKLKQKIESRLLQRFNQGLIGEIKQFEYLGECKFISLGLEYRQAWLFTQGKLTPQQLQTKLLTENLQYAKRQLTWLKKQRNLVWIQCLEDVVKHLN